MELAKVFVSGGEQAVRLPKGCEFADDEVLANRIGDVVVLVPKAKPWKGVLEGLNLFTDDFLADKIEDFSPEVRDFA